MRSNRLLNIFCLCGAGALGLALSVVIAPSIDRLTGSPAAQQASTRGHWAHHYGQLLQMQAEVEVIVIATHIQSVPGRIVSAGSVHPLPFTNQHFRADQILKGQLPQTFVVEQTGGLLPGAQRFSVDDGGAYDPGGRYLLFLNKQPDTAMYYLVNPQGRFQNEGGKLKAVVRDAVTNQIHGLSEQEAIALLRKTGKP